MFLQKNVMSKHFTKAMTDDYETVTKVFAKKINKILKKFYQNQHKRKFFIYYVPVCHAIMTKVIAKISIRKVYPKNFIFPQLETTFVASTDLRLSRMQKKNKKSKGRNNMMTFLNPISKNKRKNTKKPLLDIASHQPYSKWNEMAALNSCCCTTTTLRRELNQ